MTRTVRALLFCGVFLCHSVFAQSIHKLIAIPEDMQDESLLANLSIQADVDQQETFAIDQENLTNSGLLRGETIDTRTGKLSWEIADLVVPGNAGMDIIISRSFEKGSRNWRPHFGGYGGWELELPRLEIPQTYYMRSMGEESGKGVCDDPMPYEPKMSAESLKMHWNGMTLYLPNQAPKPVYFRQDTKGRYKSKDKYITEDHWIIECRANQHKKNNIFIVRAPNGRTYELTVFGQQGGILGLRGRYTAYITKETDQHGNWIKYDYLLWDMWSRKNDRYYNNTSLYLNKVTSSDGREVTLEYEPYRQYFMRVKRVRYLDREWQYHYSKKYFVLKEVILPDGRKWTYDYAGLKTKHGGYLEKVVTPNQATIEYNYKDWYIRNFGGTDSKYRHKLVTTRTLKGTGIKTAKWTYDLHREEGTNNNITLIKGPLHSERYVFHHTDDWQLGLMKQHEIYADNDLTKAPVKTTEYEWLEGDNLGESKAYTKDKYLFSTKAKLRQLKKKTVNGRYVTEYTDFSPYSQPGKIIEQGDKTRVQTIEYQHFSTPWILNSPTTTIIEGIGTERKTYNEKGQVTQEDKYGQKTYYKYHETGELAAKCWLKTGTEYCSQYADYKRGQPQLEIAPDGTQSRRVINDTGTVQTEIDALGYATAYTYDNADRITSIKPPIQTATEVNWSNPIQPVITKGSIKTIKTYNPLGWQLMEQQQDTTNGTTQYRRTEYDVLGRTVFTSQASLSETEPHGIIKTYDVFGRETSVRHSARPGVTTICYDAACGLADMTLGHITTNARGFKARVYAEAYGDPNNAVVVRTEQEIEDNQRLTTTYTYDLAGKLLSATQGQYTRRYEYNQKQQLEREIHPETGITTYTYDDVGNIKTKQIGESDVTHYEYDANNQLKKVTYGDTKTPIRHEYDAKGALTDIKTPDSHWHYRYNPVGQLTQEILTVDDKTYSLHYQYDTQGRLSRYTAPSGKEYHYAPDGFGRATSISGVATGIAYHPNQLIRRIELANGAQNDVEVDSSLTPTRLQATTKGAHIMQLDYVYDGTLNVRSVTNEVHPAQSTLMYYDGLDRLVGVKSESGDRYYAYDLAGNLTRRVTDNSIALHYDEATNRLSQISGDLERDYLYDLQGNVIQDGKHTYRYDEANRLVGLQGSESVTYHYDGHGHRIKRTTSQGITYEVHNKAGELIYTEDSSGKQTDYIRIQGQLLAQKDPTSGEAIYYHNNLQGSPEAATDQDGRLIWYEYYADYGKRTYDVQPKAEGIIAYTGKLEEPTTGLVYMNARYYDSAIGRFLAVDPVGFSSKDSQTFNRYAYVKNNPYKYTDPDGQIAQSIFLGCDAYEAYNVGVQRYQATGSVSDSLSHGASNFMLNAGMTLMGYGMVKAAGKAWNWWKSTDKLALATDIGVGASSGYSSARSLGASHAEAMWSGLQGAGVALFGTFLPKASSMKQQMARSGGIGFGVNMAVQLKENYQNGNFDLSELNYGSAVGSAVGSMYGSNLAFHAGGGMLGTSVTALRTFGIETGSVAVIDGLSPW